MRRGVCSATVLIFATPWTVFLTGCGGGGGNGGGTQPPPPPAPDFALALSATSVSSSPVTISITPQNGFSATVQVSLTGLPAGVATNPTSPLSVSVGQSVAVIFGAASNAPTGIGTLSPSTGPAACGIIVTVRGSGFQNGMKATLGGKSIAVALRDVDTLVFTTPSMNAGPQQLALTNPDDESVSLDAAFLAQ